MSYMRAPAPACSLPAGHARAAILLVAALAGACRSTHEQSQKPESPRQAQPLPMVAGERHTCAVDAAGHVWCWGDNSHGQLGDGTRSMRPRPVRVPLIRGAVALRADAHRTCATLDDRSEHCWGDVDKDTEITDLRSLYDRDRKHDNVHADYQLRQSVLPYPTIPASGTAPASEPAAQPGAPLVARGVAHTCERDAEQNIRCTGSNRQGQLGNGQGGPREQPHLVPGLPPAAAIAAGEDRTCIVSKAGELWCWGSGHSAPVHIALPEAAATVTAGDGFSCAAGVSGTVYCWKALQPAVPEPVAGIPKSMRLAAASEHACALVQRGAAWCWSMDKPYPWSPEEGKPVRVPGVASALDIALGYGHGCVLSRNRRLMCWRWDGMSDHWRSYDKPWRWPGQPSLAAPRGLTSALAPPCMITRAGTVECVERTDGLGKNQDQVLYERFQPVLEPPESQPAGSSAQARVGITAVTGNGSHLCGLRQDGRVRCWGYRLPPRRGADNSDLTLDYGEVAMDMGMAGMVAIAAGAAHVCGIDGTGQVLCLGDNQHGQLGLGIPLESAEPVLVELGSQGGQQSNQAPVLVPGARQRLQLGTRRLIAAGRRCPSNTVRTWASSPSTR